MALSVPNTMVPVEYPDTDGLPMAESDFQRKPLTYAVEALDLHFQAQPQVYVSGNLLLYYEEGNPRASTAPDVFVVFGAPKHNRRSYRLWQEPKAPDFILEITSHSTWRKDVEDNPPLYARLGVQEYFQYDPTRDYLVPSLQGQTLVGQQYQPLPVHTRTDGTLVLRSAVLGLELHLRDGALRFFDPATGHYLFDYQESQAARQQAEAAQRQAEAAQRQAEQQAEQVRQAAEARVQQEVQARQAAETRLAALEERLRTLLSPQSPDAAVSEGDTSCP